MITCSTLADPPPTRQEIVDWVRRHHDTIMSRRRTTRRTPSRHDMDDAVIDVGRVWFFDQAEPITFYAVGINVDKDQLYDQTGDTAVYYTHSASAWACLMDFMEFSKRGSGTWFSLSLPMFCIHRENGPAIMLTTGYQEWRQFGFLHRMDGPAIIYPDGPQEWWADGQRHRDDGPAVVWPSGDEMWFQDGEFHREGGPAVVWADGDQEWWIRGKDITTDVEEWLSEQRFAWPFTDDVAAVAFKLWFG
jgi:hypothetical protein